MSEAAPGAPGAPLEAPGALHSAEAGGRSIRGGFLRGGGYFVGLALGVVSAPLLIRHLGVAGFGRYSTALSVATIATGVTEGGVAALAVREYSVLGPGERRELMQDLLGLRVLLSAAGVAAAVAFAAVAGYSATLVLGTFVAGVGLLVVALQMLVAVPLQAGLRNGVVAAFDVLRQALTVLAIVLFVLAGAGVLPFLWSVLAGAVPTLALTVLVVRGEFPLRPRLHLARWRALAAETVPFAALTLIAVVYFRLGIVVLSLVSTPTQTGYFATAFRVLEALVGLPGVIVGALFPLLAHAGRHDLARLRSAMDRVLRVAVIGGSAMTLVVVLGAPFIVEVLIGKGGGPAVPVMRIEAFALLASFVGSACGYALLSLRRQRAVAMATALGLVINLGLVLALGGRHGAQGAAIAVTSAEAVIAVAMVTVLAREGARLPLTALLPIPAAAMVGVLMALTGLPALAQAALAGPIFLTAMLVSGAVPAELRDALRISRLR